MIKLHFNDVPAEQLSDKELSEDITTLEGMIVKLKDVQKARQSKSSNVDEVKIAYIRRVIKDCLCNDWLCYNNEKLISILKVLEGD